MQISDRLAQGRGGDLEEGDLGRWIWYLGASGRGGEGQGARGERMNKRAVQSITIIALIIGVVSFGYRSMFPARFDIAPWRSADSPAQFFARRDMMGDVYKLFDNRTLRDRETVLRY